MQRRALVVLSAALALIAAPALADAHACSRTADGHWEGHADRDGSSFRLTMDVDADHCLAYVDYPELPVFGIGFEISQDGNDLRIERHPDVGPASSLSLTQSGDTLAGTFTGAGAMSAAAVFKRTCVAAYPERGACDVHRWQREAGGHAASSGRRGIVPRDGHRAGKRS